MRRERHGLLDIHDVHWPRLARICGAPNHRKTAEITMKLGTLHDELFVVNGH